MEEMGVITRQTEPTHWGNREVTETEIRPGCAWIHKISTGAITRERTEAVSLMSNAKYTSVLDVSQGFWQIKLDEESFICCTFNTPTGRCCFLRLPDHGRRLAPISFTASVQNICFDSKLKYPEITKPSEATSRGVKNMLKKGRKQQQ